MTLTEELKAMADRLRVLFPETECVELYSRSYTGPGVNIHGIKTYSDGTEVHRRFGIQKREKQVYDDRPGGRCVLLGVVDGLAVDVFISELPPTCRIESYVEKIPKEQTVTTDEFIEVERTRVVCGEGA